jgi:hypothetical protein
MANTTKYSPEMQALFKNINSSSAGSNLFQAKLRLKRAAYDIGQYANNENQEWTGWLLDVVEHLQDILDKRKKNYIASQNQGPAEIEPPAHSTSADGGKITK